MSIQYNKGAREEEKRACEVLKNEIFGDDDQIVVGDAEEFRVPDIYSRDKSVGIEVVTCDIFLSYKMAEQTTSLGLKKSQTDERKEILKNCRKAYSLAQIYWNPKAEFISNLHKNINNKIMKLNSNAYGCKKMYLAVMADLTDFSETIDAKTWHKAIAEEISACAKQGKKQCFDRIYIVTKSKTMYVEKDLHMYSGLKRKKEKASRKDNPNRNK